MKGRFTKNKVVLVFILLFSSIFFSSHIVMAADTTPPTVTINFAGNLSDSGGPYWRPPGEATQLTGVFSDGYYTNASCQSEDWIYINCTIVDGESAVTDVWLNWLNGTAWTNYTYAFVEKNTDYWEINTSGVITTCSGYDYSFDIIANSTGGTNRTCWNKTGDAGNIVRRTVQLNCTPSSIVYTPLYLYNIPYVAADKQKRDRMHHDQGPDNGATGNDSGYLRTDIPTDDVQLEFCTSFTGNWFDESMCVTPFTLDTIYYHVWFASNTNSVSFGWARSRSYATSTMTNSKSITTGVSSLFYDNNIPTYNENYSLGVHNLDITDTSFTDNDIFEMDVIFAKSVQCPSIISNRSFTSFVLFNVPDNATLNASYPDSDSDGLSDWYELYRSYTNPFLSDTDGDSYDDNDEDTLGSDPNNWTDLPAGWVNRAPSFSSPYPTNSSTGVDRWSQLNVTVSDQDGNATTVCWWSNASGSWLKYQQNNSHTANTTCRLMNSTFSSGYNTKYWWMVTADDGHDNVSAIYDFTTKDYPVIIISSDSDFTAANCVVSGAGSLVDPYIITSPIIKSITVSGTTLNFTIQSCFVLDSMTISGLASPSLVVLDGVHMTSGAVLIQHSNTICNPGCIFKNMLTSFIGS